MPEEKGESKDPLDSAPNSDVVPENEKIEMTPGLDDKTEVSVDFDEEEVKTEDGTFEIPLVDETELALEQEMESTKDLSDRLLRLQAEFDNYRKRMDQRFSAATQYASEGILLKLLDVFDNLERSLQADFESNPETMMNGVQAIHQQMKKIFIAEDVRPITSLGQKFDPYYQNSINTINDEDQPDTLVVEEYQQGYMIRDRVLRPAAVCVNRHTPPPIEEESEDKTDSDEASSEEIEVPVEEPEIKVTDEESTEEDDYTEEKGEQQ
ncbi:MAG: nucleotide exchange factor GrpE [Candidatus Thorarchaeota archaeon]|nr:nucleotide exchange factor GrpE [Candidatus Thorarchaeota archaeon]